MKIYLTRLLIFRPTCAYHKASRFQLFSSQPTTTLSSNQSSSRSINPDSLYRRISPLGDPSISMVPVLDQWVQEGKEVDKRELYGIINELTLYRRYKHALEISFWMTDSRYIPLSPSDNGVRLNLILKTYGLEEAEKYFSQIPDNFKGPEIYVSLLNCYVHKKHVEKAEATMQKLRDMGTRSTLSYNSLMNLYYQIGSWEKLDTIMQEMEEKGINPDKYTFGIRLCAYSAASDSQGIDAIVAKMESTPSIVLDCNTYSIAAQGYLKVGLVDKALAMLKKLEGLVETSKRQKVVFHYLLKLYAAAGKKDELDRIWNLYKKDGKVFNKGYMSMMSSILKFDDIEGAEKIFEEWEKSQTRGLSYDFRIPNFLIDAYCKNGELQKAEALLNRTIWKGGTPSANAWCFLAGGYIEDNQLPKAVDSLKKSIVVCPPTQSRKKEALMTCVEYLERREDVNGAEEFIGLLKVEGIFSANVHDRLLRFIKNGN